MGNMWIVLVNAYSETRVFSNAFAHKGTYSQAKNSGTDFVYDNYRDCTYQINVIPISDEFILNYVSEKFGVEI